MSSQYEYLTVDEVSSGVAVVTLNRGAVNAISEDMFDEIRAFFEDVGHDDGLNAVVVTGAGDRAFSGGNDLHEFLELSPDNGDKRMARVWRSLKAIYDASIPVIAAVNGPALGSGFAIVSCADLVVASDRSTYCLPELNVGVLGGAKFAARMLPEQAMRRMLFTADPVSAEDMVRWGAPFEVVPHDHLRTRAIDLASHIADKGKNAVRLAKSAMNGCEPLGLFDGYALEQTYTVRMSGLPEARIATQATMDRLAANKLQSAESR
ncbi:enoyl-CoA hydratase/isomerase family protein [Streptomyces malaysiensis]|uniref:Enoyl-CoA hydratase-related protein n=1 Tax=Streptomyces malaysiensis subsp. samsunensis TaxID=459658 RepID=A0A9X2M554_STRMQ|nr:enoyl-CoA hydratase-related protein [Streptomyces samsunensis]MCQ8835487.1 enoyl-CoA hydratase-related protein [Streptomyces samsunensis]WPB89887.1 enoyl-CoA hydratase-related protein [Streptomyces malaysiensis]